MSSFARCGRCGFPLPLGPGLWGFRIAPQRVECHACRAETQSTFGHRCAWMGWLLWKLAFVGCPLLCLGMWLVDGQVSFAALAVFTGLAMLLIVLAGGPIALALAVPLQLAVELLRPRVAPASKLPESTLTAFAEELIVPGAAHGPGGPEI